MKRLILIALILVILLIIVGCGSSNPVAGGTYEGNTGNASWVFSQNGTVTLYGGTGTTDYPYLVKGNTVTIYPVKGTSGGRSWTLTIMDGGKKLSDSGGQTLTRQK